MTFFDVLHALAVCENYQWMRPVSWRGTGQAYCLHAGRICIVPTHRGAVPHLTTKAKELLGEWELVSPDQVNTEHKLS